MRKQQQSVDLFYAKLSDFAFDNFVKKCDLIMISNSEKINQVLQSVLFLKLILNKCETVCCCSINGLDWMAVEGKLSGG
jgi:hypothetical protein